jgi:hypothetical protein
MMHFSCKAHFSSSLHGTFGFWAYKGNDSLILWMPYIAHLLQFMDFLMKNGDFNDKFGIESHYKTRT